MTVRQAMRLLKECDPDAELMVSIRTLNQRYSVAQLPVYDIKRTYTGATAHVSFDEGWYVGHRRTAQEKQEQDKQQTKVVSIRSGGK